MCSVTSGINYTVNMKHVTNYPPSEYVLQDLTIVNTDVTQYANQKPQVFSVIQNVIL